MNNRFNLYFLLLFLIIFSVTADSYVKFTFNPDSVSNVKVRGFVCPNSNYNTVVGDLWNGNVLTSDTGSITLRFPSSIPYGGTNYMERYFHPNYIPYHIINLLNFEIRKA